jgi:hypothetical protein
MYNSHFKCLMKCLNEFFIDCLIFLWCRSETMADSVSVYIHFNGGNPQLFKVGYNNVTLKGLKDQLNEINQGLNLGDTRRVENIWYQRPTLDEGKIWFSRLELTNENDVRSMFSIFCHNNMFVWIDMFVTLLRSPKNILNSLILPEPEDYV